MSYPYKYKIAQAISRYLKANSNFNLENILSDIKFRTDLNSRKFSFFYSVNLDQEPDIKNILSFKDDIIQSIELVKKGINFAIDSEKYLQHTLNYDLDSNNIRCFKKPIKTVIDFSSPNIAKPFHFGHLRSTILGNFISNVSKYLGDEVVKINYLGDWGVQFGFLKYGLDQCNINTDKLNENPLRMLYNAYVTANNLAEKDPQVEEQAKAIFRKMEFAEEENEDLKQWMVIRKQTIDEISKIYNRLGIQFDEYNWESDYSAKRIENLVKQLMEKGIIVEEDGALVAKVNYNASVPFLKSDGTTLYLSRDVAAVMDRYKRYNFDKMLYVVDSSQAKHFKTLISLVDRLDSKCAEKMEHVMFGRIEGISTRKGTAIFLDDILNEIREKMERIRVEAITTKGELGGEVSDILGISAVIVNDLRRRKNSHYQFNYDVVLKSEGNSGNKLQYCHCRLFSIEENSGIKLPSECDVSVLKEPEAINLITEISKFDEIVMKSYIDLEASILIHYLFNLCDAINKAHKVLRVKGENEYLASQRLFMFHKARMTLSTGMKIIGLKPLKQM